MAPLLKTDGSSEGINPSNGADFQLEELQFYVGGHIEILYLEKDLIMCLNEEGKIHGLPVNNAATRLYHDVFGPFDIIVGNVVVCSAGEIR